MTRTFRIVTLAILCVPVLSSTPQDGRRLDPVSPEARRSSDLAIRWLLKAQNHDGSWGDNPGMPGEIGNTCIGALALMATGSTTTRGRYWRPVRRALGWLERRAKGWGSSSQHLDQNTLLQRKLGQNIDLYLLTLLNSQNLGNGIDAHDEAAVQKEMQAAVNRICKLQKPSGEWETSYEPMLTTISAWLALRQAHDAGVTVGGASAQKVVDYLKRDCLEKGSGIFREEKWGRQMRFVTQAGALRVLYGMGEGAGAEGRKATQVLMKMTFDQDVGGREGGEEFLGALFATQALHIERDTNFHAWYPRVVKSLVDCQNKDGSWYGHHCITGRVFCTSCAIMTMLTPNKMLPMIER